MKYEKIRKFVKSIKLASCAMLFSATTLIDQVEAAETADWMSGEYGVSWRFNPNNRSSINNWNVNTLVNQVKSMPGVKYVIMNLSAGAYGDIYIAPHSVLSDITPTATPDNDRDLFLEAATAFKAEGIKVIGYIACQGPAMLKHGAAAAHDRQLVNGEWYSQAKVNWADHVRDVYRSNNIATFQKAFGEIIFEEYAARYGTLVDGWWFDNGSAYYDAQQLYDIAKTHNPNSTMASNGHKSFMAYRNGHPKPLNGVGGVSPSDDANEDYLLIPIEQTSNGYFTEGTGEKTLGHMYMPIQRLWNSGEIVWDAAQGIDWKGRCLQAGGAWTWNVDVDDNLSRLKLEAVSLIQEIVAGLPEINAYPLVQIRKRNALSFCLNGGGAAPFPGQNVKLWSYIPDHVAMTWEEIDRGNGYFSYQRVGTNYSIDGGAGGDNQQNVSLQPTDASDYDQQWQKVSTQSGFIKLKKRNANFAINGGNTGANGQNVNLWSVGSGSWNLQWEVEYR